MPNDSSTGGYLVPGGPLTAPIEGKTLYDTIGDALSGVSGVTRTSVRPADQGEPPVTPDRATVWVAFSIDDRRTPTNAVAWHVVGAPSYDALQQQEEFDVTARVYGLGADGGADGVATTLRDGFQIAQNREALALAGVMFVSCEGPRRVPSLDAQRWTVRQDLKFTFRRELDVSYPVLDVASAQGTLLTDVPDTTARNWQEPISVPHA